jgi:hypothetical protein
MGLLDDAIREHLDLKRRRGADPSEIAREEAEALGPVRREAPAEERPPAHEPAALDEPAAAYDDDDVPDFEDDAPVAERDVDDDLDLDRPHLGTPPATHDHVWAEPEEESATPPHGDPLAHQPTREFSATELGEALGHEGAPAPAAEGDDADPAADDELEETPDFLQETPEHDRLWFEQKPPKDFDF